MNWSVSQPDWPVVALTRYVVVGGLKIFNNFDWETSDKGESCENQRSKLERSEEGGEFLHFIDPDGTSLYFIKPKS